MGGGVIMCSYHTLVFYYVSFLSAVSICDSKHIQIEYTLKFIKLHLVGSFSLQ